MGLEIFFTEFARNELNKIYEFIKENAGKKTGQRLTKEIVSSTEKLVNHPNIGVAEESLSGRPQNFRFIISGNYKIIYWVNSKAKRIEIVDIFDTRQDPIKIKRNK